jgi:two-component system response regulator RpfG
MATILIIDDQLTSRQILQHLVSSIDSAITVKAFANPLEAYEWCRGNPCNLILTDYKMPQMNGIEFITKFRKNAVSKEAPVIMVDLAGLNDALRKLQAK